MGKFNFLFIVSVTQETKEKNSGSIHQSVSTAKVYVEKIIVLFRGYWVKCNVLS